MGTILGWLIVNIEMSLVTEIAFVWIVLWWFGFTGLTYFAYWYGENMYRKSPEEIIEEHT